ncbi:histone-lysine N-methyltransferase 2C-like isoform X2 [Limulus polyphemus]|uniref:Histone-lysine N-methyltransferase 2C-like isoform X2 n=1 Tax=Limulus polyphemus TaxID=6850 RepID=A0ABM1BM04_LIMPO|nr:histone-lysine N-methyltransferase 2C-like isoform X2 [Limulus polyphemus]
MDEGDLGDSEALKDLLPLPQDIAQDDELMNMLMNDGDDLAKQDEALEAISSIEERPRLKHDTDATSSTNRDDPLGSNIDLLSSHFNLDTMVEDTGLPHMDSKDVEDIFKGVLTQEQPAVQSCVGASSAFAVATAPISVAVRSGAPQLQPSASQTPGYQSEPQRPVPHIPPTHRPTTPSSGIGLNSSFSLSSQAQFSTEFGSSQLSDPSSPWPEGEQLETPTPQIGAHGHKNILKWEPDEALGEKATISPVLYANINMPHLKIEYPNWPDRAKQIAKIWRSLSSEKRHPFLQKAKENRTASRMQKQQADSNRGTREPKGPKETEQELHWKQFQTLRQQKQLVQEHKVQAYLKTHQLVMEHSQGSTAEGTSSSAPSTPTPSVGTPTGVTSPITPTTLSSGFTEAGTTSHTPTPPVAIPSHPAFSQSTSGGQPVPSPVHMTSQVSACQSPLSPAHPQRSPGPSRVATSISPLIQVSRVRPPIDTNQLPPGDPYSQPPGTPRPVSAPDQFLARQRPSLIYRTPLTQPRPLFSPMSPGSQPRTESQTSGQDVFQASPATPSTDPYSQPPPTPRTVMPQDPYTQQPSTPHPAASPYSPSTGSRPSSATLTSMDPYSQAPPTPRPQQSVPDHLPSPSGTSATRYVPDLTRSQPPSHSSADPYSQPPLTPRPVSTPQMMNDPYAKQPATPRPTHVPGTTAVVSHLLGEPGVSHPEQTLAVSIAAGMKAEAPQMPRQQLRDLLQRQQLIKEQMMREQQGQIPLRHWPPEVATSRTTLVRIGTSQVAGGQDSVKFHTQQGINTPKTVIGAPRGIGMEDSFRQPLPPGMRPRVPTSPDQPFSHPISGLEHKLGSLRGQVDPRLRMIFLQQQLQLRGQTWSPGQMRMAGPSPRMSTGFGGNVNEPFDSQPKQQTPQPRQQILAGDMLGRFGQPAVCTPLTDIQQHRSTATLSTLPQARIEGICSPIQHPFPVACSGLTHPTASAAQSLTRLAASSNCAFSQPVPTVGVMSHVSQQASSFTGQPTTVLQQQPGSVPEHLAIRHTVTSTASLSKSDLSYPEQACVSETKTESSLLVASDLEETPRRRTTAEDLVKVVEEQSVSHEAESEMGDELDDDELLGLGNDFNILEYADPELVDKGLLGDGGKNNILDEHLDLDDKDEDLEEGNSVEIKPKTETEDKVCRNGIKQETCIAPTVGNDKKIEKEEKNFQDGSEGRLGPDDFQAKFLEFSQRRDLEKVKDIKEGDLLEDGHVASSNIKKSDEPDPKSVTQAPIVSHGSQESVTDNQHVRSVVRVAPTESADPLLMTSSSSVLQAHPVNIGVIPAPQRLSTINQSTSSMHTPSGQGPVGIPQLPNQVRLSHPARYIPNLPPPPPYPDNAHSGQPPPALPQPQQRIVIQRPGHTVTVIRRPLQPPVPVSVTNQSDRRQLMQNQPLLLEELVEQEKQEQRRQSQEGLMSPPADALLSDVDFERLKADVLSCPPDDTIGGPGPLLPTQGSPQPAVASLGSPKPSGTIPPQFFHQALPRPPSQQPVGWQGHRQILVSPPGSRLPGSLHPGQVHHLGISNVPAGMTLQRGPMIHGEPHVRHVISSRPASPGNGVTPRPRLPFAITSLPAPPLPPAEPSNEQERQQQTKYEQWLLRQQEALNSHQKYFETEVGKLRKAKKALNAKQRTLRKNGQELGERDAAELERISQEQAVLQKQLDQARKQSRQHGLVIQDYRVKQQKKKQQQQQPQMVVATQRPVRPPTASQGPPTPHMAGPSTPQSPMMSPSPLGTSPSPRLQHSPSPLMQHSPAPMPPSPMMQHSPRMVTSQPEGAGRPNPVHVTQDDNNPFSESFQQREFQSQQQHFSPSGIQQQQHMSPQQLPSPGPQPLPRSSLGSQVVPQQHTFSPGSQGGQQQCFSPGTPNIQQQRFSPGTQGVQQHFSLGSPNSQQSPYSPVSQPFQQQQQQFTIGVQGIQQPRFLPPQTSSSPAPQQRQQLPTSGVSQPSQQQSQFSGPRDIPQHQRPQQFFPQAMQLRHLPPRSQAPQQFISQEGSQGDEEKRQQLLQQVKIFKENDTPFSQAPGQVGPRFALSSSSGQSFTRLVGPSVNHRIINRPGVATDLVGQPFPASLPTSAQGIRPGQVSVHSGMRRPPPPYPSHVKLTSPGPLDPSRSDSVLTTLTSSPGVYSCTSSISGTTVTSESSLSYSEEFKRKQPTTAILHNTSGPSVTVLSIRSSETELVRHDAQKEEISDNTGSSLSLNSQTLIPMGHSAVHPIPVSQKKNSSFSESFQVSQNSQTLYMSQNLPTSQNSANKEDTLQYPTEGKEEKKHVISSSLESAAYIENSSQEGFETNFIAMRGDNESARRKQASELLKSQTVTRTLHGRSSTENKTSSLKIENWPSVVQTSVLISKSNQEVSDENFQPGQQHGDSLQSQKESKDQQVASSSGTKASHVRKIVQGSSQIDQRDKFYQPNVTLPENLISSGQFPKSSISSQPLIHNTAKTSESSPSTCSDVCDNVMPSVTDSERFVLQHSQISGSTSISVENISVDKLSSSAFQKSQSEKRYDIIASPSSGHMYDHLADSTQSSSFNFKPADNEDNPPDKCSFNTDISSEEVSTTLVPKQEETKGDSEVSSSSATVIPTSSSTKEELCASDIKEETVEDLSEGTFELHVVGSPEGRANDSPAPMFPAKQEGKNQEDAELSCCSDSQTEGTDLSGYADKNVSQLTTASTSDFSTSMSSIKETTEAFSDKEFEPQKPLPPPSTTAKPEIPCASCSIPPSLVQSLPTSVTNTLNFTLRQTGMPNVSLPQEDGSLTSFPRTNTQGSFTASQALSGRPITTVLRSPQSSVPTAPQPNMEVSLSSVIQSRYPLTQQGKVMSGSPSFRKVEMSLPTEQFHSYPSTSISVVTVTPCRPKLETQTADELVKTSGGSWKDYPYQTDPSPRMITPNVSFSPCGTISVPNIKLEPQDPAAEVEVKQEQEMISSVEARESMVAPEKPLGEVKTSVSVSQTIADQGAYQEQGSSSNLPSCKSETQKETLSRSFQDSFIGVPHDKNELKNELSNQKEPKMQTEMTYIDETKSCCAETAENFETKKCIKNETEVRKQTSDSEVYNNVQPQQQQDRKVIVETSVVNEEENSQEKSHCASESQDDSSREQSMSLEEGGNQNVLLKQLLRNFPSAETRRESEEFEDLVNKEEAKSATEGKVEPSSEDKDKEHPEEPKGKKPSYLDIRRAQLEKDPTPPPEDLKPKRKRPKKKKENKDGTSGKKRQRKGSKAEEDYDVFMAALMKQLRAMPPIRILEPYIKPNFNLCPVFGSRDCNNKDCQLRGSYGNATLSNQPDYYSTQPFGSNPPTPPASLPPTPPPVRGYYYQEFNRPRDQPCVDIPASLPTPPLYLDPQRNVRDAESPDTIISSSSPECGFIEPPTKFPGLRLIDSDESSNGERVIYSPTVPIVAPIPIRAVSSIHDGPPTPTSENEEEKDKENVIKAEHRSEMFATKTKMLGLGGHPAPLKDSGNVAVTLTLSSSASDDIRGVLNALADLLKIPPPATYDIVERTATPPSQKLGLYKKAKEPAANIHSLLNGKPRFCKHCDIVVLSAGIQKKASELPYISKDELEEDEVIFCSTNCYMQFALMHRSPSSSEQKEAAAVVSHLSNTTLTERHASAGENKGVTLSSESCSTPLTPTAVEGEAEAQAKLTCKNILQESDLHPDDSGLDLYGAEESAPSATSPLPETERTEEMEVSQDSEHIDGITEQEGVAHEQVGCLDEETTSSFSSEISRARKHLSIDQQQDSEPLPKKWHGLRWKLWNESYASSPKYKSPSEEEVGQALDSISICVKPDKLPRDERKCVLCHEVGDGDTEGPARLLNADVNKWVHLNCALWSAEVYETVNGALINVDTAFKRALVSACVRCQKVGASLRCFRPRCTNVYHFPCAVEEKCIFYKDKTMLCPQHVPKVPTLDSELESVAVFRRVYINREEHKQIASMIHQGDKHLIRIGSLIFLNIGQLLPHQLQAFHSPTSIYPVGYKIVRMYWSIRRLGKRCRYVCSILDFNGKPDFQIQVQEPGHDELTLKDSSPKGVWQQVLGPIQEMRRQAKTINVFPNFITGEDLFGLTEPAIVHILESLPGVDTLTDYNFRYGRSPLLELPLAINPTGCARTEPKLRTHFKRPHTLHTSNTSRSSLQSSLGGVEISSPYIKQFVHSKSSQYRKMKTDWRNNVYLARSQIQGLGLYAARDIEKHTMVIEYIGMLIRNEIAERNEREYTKQNRGVYMFRLEENKVIDATLCGGLARYINHSCYPNCVAEEVQIDREKKIMIIANRRINRGEELTYDYRFEVEDDQHKIPCLCGAPNCRKWMN